MRKVLTIELLFAIAQLCDLRAQTVSDDAIHTLTALLEGKGFVPIPAGEFVMGSSDGNPDEQPPHRVRITRPFEMGRFEVTQAQWVAVMRDPHERPATAEAARSVDPSQFRDPAKPVDSVSWDDVQRFLQKLNKRHPEYLYRLPTEAEWEYACRAGQAVSADSRLDEIAWYEAISEGRTQPVGRKKPNAWGLYDMLGNVFEWVQDGYAPDYYAASPASDPTGPATSSYKAYRGCAWLSAAKHCRPTYRGFDFPNPGHYSVGFRIVRTRR
jgi:formylglycine-generating enzyme required for sulfatase activity